MQFTLVSSFVPAFASCYPRAETIRYGEPNSYALVPYVPRSEFLEQVVARQEPHRARLMGSVSDDEEDLESDSPSGNRAPSTSGPRRRRGGTSSALIPISVDDADDLFDEPQMDQRAISSHESVISLDQANDESALDSMELDTAALSLSPLRRSGRSHPSPGALPSSSLDDDDDL